MIYLFLGLMVLVRFDMSLILPIVQQARGDFYLFGSIHLRLAYTRQIHHRMRLRHYSQPYGLYLRHRK